jgi:hypothetical protein
MIGRFTPAHQPWRRFTLLDLLLLVSCFAVGFVSVRWARDTAHQAPDLPPPAGAPETVRSPPPWPAEASNAELLVVGCVLGCVFAGPVVLGPHWLFRGRRDRISMGEWLWLGAPALVIACAAVAAVTRHLGVYARELAHLWIAVLFLGAIITASQAFWVVFFAWPIDRDDVACPWTDRFGGVVSLLTWGLVFYVVLAASLDAKWGV